MDVEGAIAMWFNLLSAANSIIILGHVEWIRDALEKKK